MLKHTDSVQFYLILKHFVCYEPLHLRSKFFTLKFDDKSLSYFLWLITLNASFINRFVPLLPPPPFFFPVVCSVSWILKPWHISVCSEVIKGQFPYLCFIKNAIPG